MGPAERCGGGEFTTLCPLSIPALAGVTGAPQAYADARGALPSLPDPRRPAETRPRALLNEPSVSSATVPAWLDHPRNAASSSSGWARMGASRRHPVQQRRLGLDEVLNAPERTEVYVVTNCSAIRSASIRRLLGGP